MSKIHIVSKHSLTNIPLRLAIRIYVTDNVMMVVADVLAWTGHQAVSTHYIAWHKYHVTAIKNRIFARGQMEGNRLLSLLLAGSPSYSHNVPCNFKGKINKGSGVSSYI